MICQASKDFINKKWPGIKDRETLLQNTKQVLINYIHPFSPPKNADENFLEKAKKRAKSMRFIANGFGVIATLTFISEIRQLGKITAYADAFTELITAFAFYYMYKEIKKLITCYNELLCESAEVNTDRNEENQKEQT